MRIALLLTSSLCLGLAASVSGQGVTADEYDRARGLSARYQSLMIDAIDSPRWVSNARLVYRKSVLGGFTFTLVDVANRDAPVRRPAFDHDRMATAIAAVTRGSYTGITLPFSTFGFTNNDQAIAVTVNNQPLTCSIVDYSCSRGPAGTGAGRGGRGGGAASRPDTGEVSPDGKQIAYINNYNVWVRATGQDTATGTALSRDGSEGNPYTRQSLEWSPNGKHLAAWRVRPGYQRMVRYGDLGQASASATLFLAFMIVLAGLAYWKIWRTDRG